jgi:hypothetical protein
LIIIIPINIKRIENFIGVNESRYPFVLYALGGWAQLGRHSDQTRAFCPLGVLDKQPPKSPCAAEEAGS